MLTTVIGAYRKPSYLEITDWFKSDGGTDTEYPTKYYINELKGLGNNAEKLFNRALLKKIRMFYEALDWDMPVDKINTLERFF